MYFVIAALVDRKNHISIAGAVQNRRRRIKKII
jgi:hypothetical protein